MPVLTNSPMASGFQRITTYGDEAILKMQAVLLTFTQIRGDRFEEATAAILNMAAALGKDLQGTALQVGKALNDPVKGVAALAEAGIQFTDQQKAQIKAMVDVGVVAGAQALILEELKVQFGGVAEAMAKTPSGQWTQAMNDLGDAFEHVGQVLTPYMVQLAAVIKDAALAFQALSPEAKTTIVLIAGIAAAAGPLLVAIGLVVQGIGGLAIGFAAIMAVAAKFTGVLVSLAGGWNVVVIAMRVILALVGSFLA